MRSKVKIFGRFRHIFATFSEYMNFNNVTYFRTLTPGVIGGPMLHSVPPSRRPQFDDGRDSASGKTHEDPVHRGPPRQFFTPTNFPNGQIPLSRRPQINQGGRPIITSNCMRGPNAAHTGKIS